VDAQLNQRAGGERMSDYSNGPSSACSNWGQQQQQQQQQQRQRHGSNITSQQQHRQGSNTNTQASDVEARRVRTHTHTDAAHGYNPPIHSQFQSLDWKLLVSLVLPVLVVAEHATFQPPSRSLACVRVLMNETPMPPHHPASKHPSHLFLPHPVCIWTHVSAGSG